VIRWLIHHLPDLACAMVALCNGLPVVLGGRTSSGGSPVGSTGGDAQHPVNRGGSRDDSARAASHNMETR
jgi:hypothetical protein